MAILGFIGAFITGISLGLIGGGGSILIVPILVYLFMVTPTIATAYSLFVVGLASAVGAYAKKDLIDYKVAGIFAVPSILGVLSARRFLIPNIPTEIITLGEFILTKDRLIMIVFALVMLAASYSMIRKKKDDDHQDSEKAMISPSAYPLIALEGLLVGSVTGFVGAGGGFLIIPALVVLAKVPMKQAVGTSLLIIAVKSLLGFLGDMGQAQNFDWTLLISVTALAAVGIFFGNRLSKRIPGQLLKPVFGWFVLVMGAYIMLQQIL